MASALVRLRCKLLRISGVEAAFIEDSYLQVISDPGALFADAKVSHHAKPPESTSLLATFRRDSAASLAVVQCSEGRSVQCFSPHLVVTTTTRQMLSADPACPAPGLSVWTPFLFHTGSPRPLRLRIDNPIRNRCWRRPCKPVLALSRGARNPSLLECSPSRLSGRRPLTLTARRAPT